ncbi:hypothetical protein B0H11DRAFT_1932731 [Mycena galericulata]|nr:hypothetical protein B0H11DRAFT_1932731 [Mycena galericulata]
MPLPCSRSPPLPLLLLPVPAAPAPRSRCSRSTAPAPCSGCSRSPYSSQCRSAAPAPVPAAPAPRCSRPRSPYFPVSALPAFGGAIRDSRSAPRSPLPAPGAPAPGPLKSSRRIFDAPSRITSNADKVPDARPPFRQSSLAISNWWRHHMMFAAHMPSTPAQFRRRAPSLSHRCSTRIQGRRRPPNSGAHIFSLESGAITVVDPLSSGGAWRRASFLSLQAPSPG